MGVVTCVTLGVQGMCAYQTVLVFQGRNTANLCEQQSAILRTLTCNMLMSKQSILLCDPTSAKLMEWELLDAEGGNMNVAPSQCSAVMHVRFKQRAVVWALL